VSKATDFGTLTDAKMFAKCGGFNNLRKDWKPRLELGAHSIKTEWMERLGLEMVWLTRRTGL
jgi:hypothetical protein